MKVLHNERQALLPPIGKIVVAIFTIGLLMLMTFDQEVQPWWIYLIVFIIALLVNLLVWLNMLHLMITTHDVRYKYPPIMNNWKVIPREHIKGYSVNHYNWFKFGGWGYRYDLFHGGGWAFTTLMNKQVVIINRNTKNPVAVGTSQPKKVKGAMDKMLNNMAHE